VQEKDYWSPVVINTDLAGNLEKVAAAQKTLAVTTREDRDAYLSDVAESLRNRSAAIFEANRKDIERAEKEHLAKPLIKRLVFDRNKLDSVLAGIDQVISLPDPNNKILEARELDEGLILKRVSCPIGVIGMIFESRPDALIQIASLCIKSGNGIVLKGGSEAADTNRILASIFQEAAGARKRGGGRIPPEWIYLLETRDQVKEMLKLDAFIDLLIPRGSNSFVKYIMDNTNIPVLGHSEGICHSYIDADADIAKAVLITVDAKSQYPAVCNALETLLVNREIAPDFLPPLAAAMKKVGVELRGDAAVCSIIECIPAEEADWHTEYLDLILSIKIVDSFESAVNHIHTYGSGHTDSIITESPAQAELFMQTVDSADVMWNCSTRFSDGFRYGLGAEVGISTLKIHARGPVGLEGLMSYKWKLYGSGQIAADYTGPNPRKFTHKNILQEQVSGPQN
jgi:glutamate-5-semialdehyde dehydrogenase